MRKAEYKKISSGPIWLKADTENVNKYKFNIFYNPKMWNPFSIDYTD